MTGSTCQTISDSCTGTTREPAAAIILTDLTAVKVEHIRSACNATQPCEQRIAPYGQALSPGRKVGGVRPAQGWEETGQHAHVVGGLVYI